MIASIPISNSPYCRDSDTKLYGQFLLCAVPFSDHHDLLFGQFRTAISRAKGVSALLDAIVNVVGSGSQKEVVRVNASSVVTRVAYHFFGLKLATVVNFVGNSMCAARATVYPKEAVPVRALAANPFPAAAISGFVEVSESVGWVSFLRGKFVKRSSPSHHVVMPLAQVTADNGLFAKLACVCHEAVVSWGFFPVNATTIGG